MLMLVKNEWLKLIKKKSSWIMWIILVVLTFSLTFLIKKTSGDAGIKANDLFSQLTQMTSALNLFVVIVAASSVAEEFSRGTIKFLLIRPYTRGQILLSKFLVCLIYGLIGTAILFVSSLVFSNLLLGAQSPLAVVSGFYGWNALEVALASAGSNLLLVLLYISMTMFISAAIRSQSLAVGVGLGFLFGSSVINNLLMILMQKHHWLKWNIFNMMNIKSTIGETTNEVSDAIGRNLFLNFWEMAAGLLVYSAIIYFFTQLLFRKRDVSLS